MTQTYFLGANTKDGFHSIYDSFPPKSGDFLHIIKGGPGSGKSSFMRKIGAAAEARELDVHYVLCSGDPASLDGLYIPALHLAWVDGTAPHAQEPGVFGVDSDYVNLGKYCKTPLPLSAQEHTNDLSRSYKQQYSQAYDYLSAVSKLADCKPKLFGDAEKAAIKKRVNGLLERNIPRTLNSTGTVQTRFLAALSCIGEYRLTSEVEKLCKRIFQFDNSYLGADFALKYVAERAKKRGAELILCPSPIDPAKLEAVILPEYELAFVDESWQLEGARHIRIDGMVPLAVQQESRQELRELARLESRLLALAYSKLRRAKELHDELEAVYKPHMSFAALTKFTDAEIKKLFK